MTGYLAQKVLSLLAVEAERAVIRQTVNVIGSARARPRRAG